MSDTIHRIHIIGGGFAGLTCAFYLCENLQKLPFKIIIYEKESRLGGLIGTHQIPEGLYETAANAILKTPRVMDLCSSLHIQLADNLGTAKKRFIFRDKLCRWPLSLIESLGLFAKLAGVFLFKRSSLIPRAGETLESWGKRNLTSSAKFYLLETGLQGIYGANTKNLSASLVLGSIFGKNKKKKKYQGLVSPELGMQEVITKLQEYLQNKGVEFCFNSSVKSISDLQTQNHRNEISPESYPHRDFFVIATKAHEAAELLNLNLPEVAKPLSNIGMHNKTSITIFYQNYPKTSSPYRGFGCLIPAKEGFQPLGILMNSFIFSGREKNYNENWIFSDQSRPFWKNKSEQELIEILSKSRKDYFGEELPILKYKMIDWTPALPIYDIRLEKALTAINLFAETLKNQRLYLHGNYLGQIGLSGILERSFLISQEIKDAIKI